MGFPGDSAGKESTHNVGNLGLIPDLRRSQGKGNGYPLQYSGLEKSMDTAHSVTESDMTELLSLSLSSGLYRIYLFKTFYDIFWF